MRLAGSPRSFAHLLKEPTALGCAHKALLAPWCIHARAWAPKPRTPMPGEAREVRRVFDNETSRQHILAQRASAPAAVMRHALVMSKHKDGLPRQPLASAPLLVSLRPLPAPHVS